LISIGALKVQSLRGTLEEGVLKMSNDSLVVLKGIRRNNLHSLKGSAVNEKLAASEHSEDDSIRLSKMRLEQDGLNSLKAFAM